MFNLLLMLLPLLGSVSTESYPDVLSSEEEEKYLKLWQQKDENARNTLIEHNLRLVAHIVKKFENTKEDKDDLLSIGAFGLIKAVDSYNFESNAKLATYASRCIENEILMYLRSNNKKKQTVWLYSPIGVDKEGNEIHLSDIIEDQSPSVMENILKTENANKINEALNILSDLSGNDKLVGVISHVSELMSRIDNKIYVHKTNTGSTINIEANK